jgi:hypothetical protein
MKKIVSILAMLIAAEAGGYANDSSSSQSFIRVPNSIWEYGKHEMEKIPASELADKGIEYLAGYPWRGDHKNSALPKEFHGFRLDLNKDGHKEYFIDIEPFGGSGGAYFIILGNISKQWSVIGDFQGAFYLLPVKNGWHPIMVISRGGAEIYAKEYFEFFAGKYRERWMQNFVWGKITKQSIVKTNADRKKVKTKSSTWGD